MEKFKMFLNKIKKFFVDKYKGFVEWVKKDYLNLITVIAVGLIAVALLIAVFVESNFIYIVACGAGAILSGVICYKNYNNLNNYKQELNAYASKKYDEKAEELGKEVAYALKTPFEKQEDKKYKEVLRKLKNKVFVSFIFTLILISFIFMFI